MMPNLANKIDAGDEDELFKKATEMIKSEGKASTSFLQRNFKLDIIELPEL